MLKGQDILLFQSRSPPSVLLDITNYQMGAQNVTTIVIPATMALHAKRVLLQSVRCVLQPVRHHHHA